jgi:hypothetical protein
LSLFPIPKLFQIVFHIIFLILSSIYKNVSGHLPFTKYFEVIFHLKYFFSLSSFFKLRLPVVILTKYSYFDTPTDGRPAYSDIKANLPEAEAWA